jgi:penicillin-binding protein 1B
MSRRSISANQRKNKKVSTGNVYGWIIFQLFIICFFCSATYIIWLDYRIQTEFEGKRWSIPASVYASPVELYSGLQIDRRVIEQQLRIAGYQRVNQPRHPGEYTKAADSFRIFSRGFAYWDGLEISRKIKLDFSGNDLKKLIDEKSGRAIPVMRLEPELIGKIYPDHHEDRILINFDDIPPLLIDALIAVEDRNYFLHIGIDLKGILRAFWTNLLSGEVKQGGSTLTQQLVKNFFLTHERTIWRKFNEIIMSLLLEYRYSKAEILEAYINEIYLGQHGAFAIHGFGTAARYYYSRPLNELNLDQLALLVAMVRGASFYNPRKHPERALARRNLIIQQMQDQLYIDDVVASEAKSTPLNIVPSPGWSNTKYPAYMDIVNRQLQKEYNRDDLKSEGLRIFTTLNPVYQDIAEKAINARLTRYERDRNLSANLIQIACVISSVETGEILAVVGGRDRENTGFNRAIDAYRPIGSLIKPVIYLTALSQPEKYNVLTLLEDATVKLKQQNGKSWIPDNYDGKAHGNVPLHIALENSYNLATVRLGLEIGMPRIRSELDKMGIDKPVPDYPSIYLGSLELSPLQVTQIYQTLASNGFQIPLRTIREVLDKNGRPLQRFELGIQQTVDSRAVFIINFLLTRVIQYGTARSLNARLPELMPLAGKTGTTNELRDSWFAGFGDNVLAVIWLGRDDNKSTDLTGASGALQLWADIMQEIRPQPVSLVAPDGISMQPVFQNNRVTNNCPGSDKFPFFETNLPPAFSCNPTKQYNEPVEQNPWSIFNIFR